MMNIIINIDKSFILQESIIRSNYNSRKLEKFKNKISNFLNNHKEVFEKIYEITGLKWNIKILNIWVFEGKQRTIPNPFLLNVEDYDFEHCIFELIHMLIHIIFQDNHVYWKFEKNKGINGTDLEATTYFITKIIFNNLFSEKSMKRVLLLSEESGFRKYIWDRVKDLEKVQNIKELLKMDSISF